MDAQLYMQGGKLIATIHDCVFSSEKLNELFSRLNLPHKVKYAKIAELVLEIQFVPRCKCRVIINGLEMVLMFCEQKNSTNLLDSMLESFYEQQEDVLTPEVEEHRYDSITAHTSSKNLILSIQDITDIILDKTSIRIEHHHENSTYGFGLELKVDKIQIFPEAQQSKNVAQEGVGNIENDQSAAPNALFSRHLSIEGISLYSDEFTDVRVSEDNSALAESDMRMEDTSCKLVKFLSIPSESFLNASYNELSNTSDVTVDLILADIHVFITPRQIFLISQLVSAMNEVQSKSPTLESVPLTASDYQMLEREQAAGATTAELGIGISCEFDTMSIGQLRGPSGVSGWSVPQQSFAPESNYNYDFPIDSNTPEEENSYYKPQYAHSTTSDFASVITKTDISRQTRPLAKPEQLDHSREWMSDPSSHITEFRLKVNVNSIYSVVLHEDVIVPDGAATFKELNAEACIFFSSLELEEEKNVQKNVSCLRDLIRKKFSKNHFQFAASTISVEIISTQDNKSVDFRAEARIDNMEIVECVSNINSTPCLVEILSFVDNCVADENNPCLNLMYHSVSEIRNMSKNVVDCGSTKSNLSLSLTSCVIEIDLSMIDRAEAFFQCPNFYNLDLDKSNCSSNVQGDTSIFVQTFKQETQVNCSCSSLDIRLRFPVPDLRPISDILTKEIWKRNVRNDILIFKMLDIKITTLGPSTICNDEISLVSTNAYLNFQENSEGEVHKLGEIFSIEESSPIKIVFAMSSSDSHADPYQRHQKRPERKSHCSSATPSLFFEKNYVPSHKSNVSEPLLQPVDITSFNKFISEECNDAEYKLHVSIPYVKLFLPSKHIYELVYNRLAYDLILWQPHSSHPLNSSSVQVIHSVPDSFLGDSMTASIYHSFRCETDDSQSDTNEDNNGLMDEIATDLLRKKVSSPASTRSTDKRSVHPSKTLLALTLKIGEGSVDLRTPNVDDDGQTSNTTNGRVILDISDVSVYVAGSFNGDPNKSYVGVYSTDVLVAHHPLWPSGDESSEPDQDPKEMSVVISRCSNDLFREINEEPIIKSNMLSLVMEFDFDEARNVNTMCLAGKLSQAQYRLKTQPFSQMWLSQIQDMFAVQDYPINGYEMPEIVNDVHFQFENCIVRYNPELIDTEAFLFVGSLIFASSLSYSCDTSIFRMILEDASFFLRKASFPENMLAITKLLNCDLLQITIRHVLRKKNSVPDKEVIIVGGLITLITCTDSLNEFINFIKCVTGNDSEQSNNGKDVVNEQTAEPVFEHKHKDLLPHQKDLLTDAISDNSQSRPVEMKASNQACASPFVFPDEVVKVACTDNVEPIEAVRNDICTVLDVDNRFKKNYNSNIIFNHSIWPCSKNNLNKRAMQGKSTDTPVIRWNIKEISLCWKLCQGNAFLSSESSFKPPSNKKSERASPSSVTYSTKDARLSFNQPSPSYNRKYSIKSNRHMPRSYVEIYVKGVKYCYEEFLPDCNCVCGHNITARDIEIVDLVPTSTLRKLLCRYVTDEYPIGNNSDFLSLNLTVKRRPLEDNSEEFHLTVSLGNIRMYIDQTTASFLKDFFSEFAQLSLDNQPQSSAIVRLGQPPRPQPVAHPQRKPFFKSVVFNPAILIVIDFEGNFSEIGSFNELILALASANKITLRLKEINFQRGILGMERVAESVKKVWLDDIYNNQKIGLMKLFAPLGLLIDILGGMWQLVEIPIQHYMKDGNVFRGIVIGSQVFTCRSMSATFGLLGKFFNCLENVASFVMVVVSPNHRVEGSRAPPPNALSGVVAASDIVRSGVMRVTSNVVASTRTEGMSRGVGGALSGFTRHIPEIICTPPLLATQVTNVVLSGLHQQWTPGNDREIKQKYK